MTMLFSKLGRKFTEEMLHYRNYSGVPTRIYGDFPQSSTIYGTVFK